MELSTVGVRNLVARVVTIPQNWCWEHQRECVEDHKPERPKVPLVGRLAS